jgi:hypothetical protein
MPHENGLNAVVFHIFLGVIKILPRSDLLLIFLFEKRKERRRQITSRRINRGCTRGTEKGERTSSIMPAKWLFSQFPTVSVPCWKHVDILAKWHSDDSFVGCEVAGEQGGVRELLRWRHDAFSLRVRMSFPNGFGEQLFFNKHTTGLPTLLKQG